MFSDLTDDEIKMWKAEICRFLRNNAGKSSITIPGTSVSYSYDQCFKILEELNAEQSKRSGKRNTLIPMDISQV